MGVNELTVLIVGAGVKEETGFAGCMAAGGGVGFSVEGLGGGTN